MPFKDRTNIKYGKLTAIEYLGKSMWKCKCDCGGEAITDATNLRHGTTNSCGCLKSKGEMLINNWLQEHNIPFQSQYSIDEIILDSGRRPFFDFAIFDNENNLICLIEYNGVQHYKATGGWNDEEMFEITQHRDKQKSEWCKKLNIPLYIISYLDNIEEKLEGIIK